jgi:TRAP-type transport system periplasmic protein
MKNKIGAVIVLMFLLSGFLFAGGSQESGSETDVVEIVFTTPSGPGEEHTKSLKVVKQYIEDHVEGRMIFIYHDSGSLFSQDAELPATIKNNVTMCYTDASWLGDYMSSIKMFSAGYIFSGPDHMDKVLNGKIGETLFEQVAKEVGVRPLSAYYMGSRTINLRQAEPAMTPADLKGIKMRMPNSETWLFLGKALGANPVPIDWGELYTSLQTGAVDGQDNPLPGIKEGKFYEVTKSISLTNHVVGAVWPAINESVWHSLDSDLQQILVEAFEAGRMSNDKAVKNAEASLVAEFEAEGLTVVVPDIAAFKSTVNAYYLNDKEFTKDWDMDLFNKIKNTK